MQILLDDFLSLAAVEGKLVLAGISGHVECGLIDEWTVVL
jgi:hypothetical protein